MARDRTNQDPNSDDLNRDEFDVDQQGTEPTDPNQPADR